MMLLLLVVVCGLLLTAALAAGLRLVARDGGARPKPPSSPAAEWHPDLRSRPYSED